MTINDAEEYADYNYHSPEFGIHNSSELKTPSHHSMWKDQSLHPFLMPEEKRQNDFFFLKIKSQMEVMSKAA